MVCGAGKTCTTRINWFQKRGRGIDTLATLYTFIPNALNILNFSDDLVIHNGGISKMDRMNRINRQLVFSHGNTIAEDKSRAVIFQGKEDNSYISAYIYKQPEHSTGTTNNIFRHTFNKQNELEKSYRKKS